MCFSYQSSHQERIIHSCWKTGLTYRYLLEGSGDIFRELTKYYKDAGYILEKIKRIESYFTRKQQLEDSFETAFKENQDKFLLLKQKLIEQPTDSEEQKIAVELNLALIDNDIYKIKQLITKIKTILNESRINQKNNDRRSHGETW
jgi:hypothetical protein